MAVNLAGRVPLERIGRRARPVRLGPLVAACAVGALYALAFGVRKAALVAGVLLGWAAAALVTGWQDAARPAEERRRAGVA